MCFKEKNGHPLEIRYTHIFNNIWWYTKHTQQIIDYFSIYIYIFIFFFSTFWLAVKHQGN